MSQATDERLDSLERWKDEMEQRWKDAFPDGDHSGHCRFHQAVIENVLWKKRLWQVITEKTVGGLVWSTLIALGVIFWLGLKEWFKRTFLRGE